MGKFTHITLEEREKLYAWLESGESIRECGRRLGRDHGALSREIKKNSVNGTYVPCKADAKARTRGLKQRRKAPLKNSSVYLYVRIHLREGWSPEQIAGRMPLDLPGESIHLETIYRYVYSPLWQIPKENLYLYLPLARKKRMKKEGRRVRRVSRIKGAVSIDLRPASIQERNQAGHWETDNVIGKQADKTVLSTTVERKSRYLILSKLPAKTAKEKRKAVVLRLQPFPSNLKQSITCDNGLENTCHEQITTALKSKIYFTHPYHSWEKGTNENTNGRLRRFIPKGVSIDLIGDKTIDEIEKKMNNTPRKCLNFKTPNEVMTILMQNSV